MAHRRHEHAFRVIDAGHLATERWGGDGPAEVLFVHPTGFCKEIWHPVISALAEKRPETSGLSVDLRGHGDSPGGPLPYTVDGMTRDVLRTIHERRLRVGVGHSLGGAVIARAQALDAELFERIVLIEPIILPPPHGRADHALARGAARRRPSFPTRESARQRFATGPFADWVPAAVDAYVDHGFVSGPGGWELKCPPATEADVFREGLNHDTWELVASIEVPVTLVSGARSDTHPPQFLDALAERFAKVDRVIIEDAGHFAPMERPERVADIVSDALDPR